jgi:Flp pilus assembly protein TadG
MIRRRKTQQGQSTVEFAVILPVLLTILLGIVELGSVFSDYIAVTGAARDAARVASVSRLRADGESAAIAAGRASAGGLDSARLGIDVDTTWEQGDDVTITVTYPYSVELYGMPVISGTLRSASTMRME